MAVPSTPQKTAQRATQEFTRGTGLKRTEVASLQTQPNVGKLATIPRTIVPVAVDYQVGSGAIGALGAGASQTLAITVSLPNFPAQLSPQTLDKIYFVPIATIFHNLPGLVLGSLTVTPQGLANGVQNQGFSLSPGQTYTAWSVLVTATMTAVAATGAGTVSCQVAAVLYDTPG